MRAVVVLVCASCSFRPAPVTGGGDDASGDDAHHQDAFVFGDGAPPDWWNTSWTFRMPLQIHDSVALAIPPATVVLTRTLPHITSWTQLAVAPKHTAHPARHDRQLGH